MGDLLINSGWKNETARQLASWDPYDQNASSPFFDSEWMFGISNGFDIVIGNPPYVDSETMTRNNVEFRDILKSKYGTAKGNWDLFVIFIERGLGLASSIGSLSFIVPNKLISAKYTQDLRQFLSKKSIIELIDYSAVDVFAEVDVYPIVFLITNNTKIRSDVKTKVMSSLGEAKTENIIKNELFHRDIFWDKYFFDKPILDLVIKISDNTPLGKIFPEILGSATVSEAYEIKEHLQELNKQKNHLKFINTGTIDPYLSHWGQHKTQYIKSSYLEPIISEEDLRSINSKRLQQSKSAKIIISGMALRIEAFYDRGEYCAGKSTSIIIGDKENLKAITGILNSKVISFWFSKYFNSLSMAGGYFNIGPNELGQIPISKNLKLPLFAMSTLVEYMICLRDSSDNKFSFFESLIDAITYELYLNTMIKARNCEVIKHLNNLPKLDDAWAIEKRLSLVDKLFNELSNPKHLVARAMAMMQEIEEVKIIEGRK